MTHFAVILSLSCALFFLSALLAFPQSSFLKKGQSGFGLSGAYATSNEASGWSGTAAVSLGGIYDLSFSVGRPSYDPVSSGFNALTSTSIMPELTAHVIKQNSSRSPVSLTWLRSASACPSFTGSPRERCSPCGPA